MGKYFGTDGFRGEANIELISAGTMVCCASATATMIRRAS